MRLQNVVLYEDIRVCAPFTSVYTPGAVCERAVRERQHHTAVYIHEIIRGIPWIGRQQRSGTELSSDVLDSLQVAVLLCSSGLFTAHRCVKNVRVAANVAPVIRVFIVLPTVALTSFCVFL